MSTRTLLTLPELRTLLNDHNAAQLYCSEEDFLLGLSDLTGELMRWGINCVGSAGLGVEDTVQSVKMAQDWVRQIQSGALVSLCWSMPRLFVNRGVEANVPFTGMRPLGVNVRGLYSKLNVMDNTLIKLEKGLSRSVRNALAASAQYHPFPPPVQHRIPWVRVTYDLPQAQSLTEANINSLTS